VRPMLKGGITRSGDVVALIVDVIKVVMVDSLMNNAGAWADTPGLRRLQALGCSEARTDTCRFAFSNLS
jgi:hypothetical protein